ncbi:hypothetical protein BDD12DRAFT_281652 [Trichophaea hybrida]|nr:hypothetical protein BDD12DRAFT_281652 [Trichophaea hybrida]
MVDFEMTHLPWLRHSCRTSDTALSDSFSHLYREAVHGQRKELCFRSPSLYERLMYTTLKSITLCYTTHTIEDNINVTSVHKTKTIASNEKICSRQQVVFRTPTSFKHLYVLWYRPKGVSGCPNVAVSKQWIVIILALNMAVTDYINSSGQPAYGIGPGPTAKYRLAQTVAALTVVTVGVNFFSECSSA